MGLQLGVCNSTSFNFNVAFVRKSLQSTLIGSDSPIGELDNSQSTFAIMLETAEMANCLALQLICSTTHAAK